ncbi:MAG: GNAT family N-acetyltransferase, partial [Rudanella sp.]|nr:GNAT family N-acetyltransferase [Rudanella sp.]
FGSIEFAETVAPFALGEFVDKLIQKASLTGCKRLQLVNYPHCYAPRHMHRLVYTLTEQGFNIIKSTPTFYLPVHDGSLTERMHPQEQQRLRKCQRAGLKTSLWENPCIPTIIDFIEESRQQQGYPLTIPTDCLSRLLHQFPEQFPVFVVRDGETIAALCVCVRVRHDILYSFLPASLTDYQLFSPMVMLIDHVYQYSQQAGIDLLDLGPSLDANQQPKPSLARFKQNMGAITSPKLTFEIEL